jgi:dTDP-glucose pyrophosphorylase
LRDGDLTHSILDGWWTDAGTFESLHAAANLVAATGANKINGQIVRLDLHQVETAEASNA